MSKSAEEPKRNEPKGKTPEVSPSPDKVKPSEHLEATVLPMTRRQRDNFLAMHAAAAVMHKWPNARDVAENGASHLLSREDYTKAIAAVDTNKPHRAALYSQRKAS